MIKSHHLIKSVPASTWREFKAEADKAGLKLALFLARLIEHWKEENHAV